MRLIEDFTERIERGVALLDDVVPDWHTRVDPRRLQIRSGYRCVVAQVARSRWPGHCGRSTDSPYGVGMTRLGLTNGAVHGFYLPAEVLASPLNWWRLNRQWKATIRRLQAERASQRKQYDLAR